MVDATVNAEDGFGSNDKLDDQTGPTKAAITEPGDSKSTGLSRLFLSLRELGIEYSSETENAVEFVRSKERLRFRSECAIPRTSLEILAQQIEHPISEHPTLMGFLSPSCGYAEILVRDSRWPRPPITTEFILRMRHDEVDCVHRLPESALPSLPYAPRAGISREGLKVARIHLAGTSRPCIELSNASPLAALLYGRMRADYPGLLLTIKIDYNGSADSNSEFVQNVEALARSLLYELDVRNRRVISLVPRELSPDARRRHGPSPALESVRYPEIEIRQEVADLFNFASIAYENPALAFLSYYQTLEYFVPAAVRQNIINKVRRELRDPTFDRDSDRCLMRVVSATERAIRLPEPDQIRIMVCDQVRSDRLEEFFATDWGNHFSKHGPIHGVEIINLRNSTKTVPEQVADRVYQIRNRIVHAKDDPRYEEARVLLPRGHEAQSLGPDVELVRLLASEAILSAQR